MKKRGFTLPELLVYCGLLAILLVVITNVFMSILNLQLETETVSGQAQDGQYILSRLSYDLRRASSVTSPALGGTSASLSVIIDGVSYQYGLDGNNNLVVAGQGQLNSFLTTVSDLSFTHLGTVGGEEDTIQIGFNLGDRFFQTTIGLRSN
jgi:type II secretory pathway component PulJ